jgi:hypothetical protein
MSKISKKERFIQIDSEAKLLKWFKRLTPEQRLNIALEIEEFRRGAKLVKSRKNI